MLEIGDLHKPSPLRGAIPGEYIARSSLGAMKSFAGFHFDPSLSLI